MVSDSLRGGQVGADLTYRMFMANDDATIEAAKAEPLNAGLPYAHPFPGANGCNAEVVYEMKPSASGGLFLSASLEQLFVSVLKTVRWYATAEEVVILASRAAYLQAASHPLPADPGCTVEYEEIVRFSRSFICKTTGARVLASVGDSGGGLGTPSNPVRYADLFPEIEGISEADANFQQRSVDFSLSLTAEQAPTSCEAMYWDPYLQTPLGGINKTVALQDLTQADGDVAGGGDAAPGSVSADDPAAGGGSSALMIGLGVGGGCAALVVVAMGVYCLVCRRGSAAKVKGVAPGVA